MTDIEDMGIVWGAGVMCSLHGWYTYKADLMIVLQKGSKHGQ